MEMEMGLAETIMCMLHQLAEDPVMVEVATTRTLIAPRAITTVSTPASDEGRPVSQMSMITAATVFAATGLR